jgi:hypothetical protein
MQRMADWRHIQGKIRKARTSSDPPGQLAALYESTRDAMVAFELARLYEKNGSNAEAAQWYMTAAEKFRRAQWKTKAQEALVRLGVDVPLAATEAAALASERPHGESHDIDKASDATAVSEAEIEAREATGEPDADADAGLAAPGEAEGAGDLATGGVIVGSAADAAKKRRRRGRRGGRGRRKKLPGVVGTAPVANAQAVAPGSEQPIEPPIQSRPSGRPFPSRSGGRPPVSPRRAVPSEVLVESRRQAPEQTSPREAAESSMPEGMVGPAAWQGRRRAGEPALASRLALLESQLRRMLAAPPAPLDDAERAPAGPGVFVLSDSELIDHYYVEACQTLRIGIGNLVRSGRSRGGENIKAMLAEHLGITEARVAKYMKDHCAIRWIQLDVDAPLVAHFAIAVLRPALNEEER